MTRTIFYGFAGGINSFFQKRTRGRDFQRLLNQGIMQQEVNRSSLDIIETLASLKKMSDKVFNHFIVHYPNASDIMIREAGTFLFITFSVSDVAMRAAYDAKGTQLYSIKYLDVHGLDSKITQRLGREYPQYSIVRATEVDNGNASVCLVTIADSATELIVKFVK